VYNTWTYADLDQCRCVAVKKEAEAPTEFKWDTAEGKHTNDEKVLKPGDCKRLEISDWPGITRVLSLGGPFRSLLVAVAQEASFQTYLAVKCDGCDDPDDCIWYKLALWEWHYKFTAGLVGAGSPKQPPTWRNLCGVSLDELRCSDYEVLTSESSIDSYTTYDCEKLDLPCHDPQHCDETEMVTNPCVRSIEFPPGIMELPPHIIIEMADGIFNGGREPPFIIGQ
jgi:hypothetical protein